MVTVNRNCFAPLVGKYFSIPASRSENNHNDQDDRCKMIFIGDCHTLVCARLGAGMSALVDTAN
jgi:hypothetical protein